MNLGVGKTYGEGMDVGVIQMLNKLMAARLILQDDFLRWSVENLRIYQ